MTEQRVIGVVEVITYNDFRGNICTPDVSGLRRDYVV
jgi:hypothetical protein